MPSSSTSLFPLYFFSTRAVKRKNCEGLAVVDNRQQVAVEGRAERDRKMERCKRDVCLRVRKYGWDCGWEVQGRCVLTGVREIYAYGCEGAVCSWVRKHGWDCGWEESVKSFLRLIMCSLGKISIFKKGSVRKKKRCARLETSSHDYQSFYGNSINYFISFKFLRSFKFYKTPK